MAILTINFTHPQWLPFLLTAVRTDNHFYLFGFHTQLLFRSGKKQNHTKAKNGAFEVTLVEINSSVYIFRIRAENGEIRKNSFSLLNEVYKLTYVCAKEIRQYDKKQKGEKNEKKMDGLDNYCW